jgi:hypothetical protein
MEDLCDSDLGIADVSAGAQRAGKLLRAERHISAQLRLTPAVAWGCRREGDAHQML